MDVDRWDGFRNNRTVKLDKPATEITIYRGEIRRVRQDRLGRVHITVNARARILRMMKRKDGLMDWVKKSTKVLDKNLSTFIEFVMISGIRRGEAINSLNLITRFSKTGKLSNYYNSEMQSLEHFRFEDVFMRRTKNVFFSFISKSFIDRVALCDPISYTTLKRRLKENCMKLRLNELRDHFATFMVHNGLIREEVDILQGRIGKTLFMRHYFSPNVTELRDKVLKAITGMIKKLS